MNAEIVLWIDHTDELDEWHVGFAKRVQRELSKLLILYDDLPRYNLQVSAPFDNYVTLRLLLRIEDQKYSYTTSTVRDAIDNEATTDKIIAKIMVMRVLNALADDVLARLDRLVVSI